MVCFQDPGIRVGTKDLTVEKPWLGPGRGWGSDNTVHQFDTQSPTLEKCTNTLEMVNA